MICEMQFALAFDKNKPGVYNIAPDDDYIGFQEAIKASGIKTTAHPIHTTSINGF